MAVKYGWDEEDVADALQRIAAENRYHQRHKKA